MIRPVVGLTTYAEEARFGLQDTYAAVLPWGYVRGVHAVGGRAVLIPPDEPDVDVLDGLDAILFSGGPDIDPALYGEPAQPGPRPHRDTAEVLLLRAAVEADLPVLGVCRGMQLMAAVYGGALHRHLPEVLGHDGHRPVAGPKFGAHSVRLAPGSLAHRVLGAEATVNSFHHQGIRSAGTLTATGWCDADGLVEVVEDPARTFVLGVQWHPEEMSDLRLFVALVSAARKRRGVLAAGPASLGDGQDL